MFCPWCPAQPWVNTVFYMCEKGSSVTRAVEDPLLGTHQFAVPVWMPQVLWILFSVLPWEPLWELQCSRESRLSFLMLTFLQAQETCRMPEQTSFAYF